MPPNRLAHEKSPYLLQHAHNPVDWYPWGDEAFDAARAADKPVFLSIGYATCHWCHVMEHESFEDEAVATLMNDAFINIKVDREERPDIDGIYMTVAQMATGQGGWPLTIVMTPDRLPFFSGTYFPKESRFGRPGMVDLVPRIRELWETRRSELLDAAGSITDRLRQMATADQGGRVLDHATLEEGFRALSREFDWTHGGFGRAPKFPTPHRLLFLLRYWRQTESAHALEMVERTLDEMRAGGVYDQVGFGFHRYSTDGEWLVPHFEKMLYDQALLVMAYVEAWRVTGADRHQRHAREILAYVLRDMTSPEGGFYSAEDADSEGEEGKFYVWSLDEMREALGEEDAEIAALVWGATPQGNYLEEATKALTGTNILYVSRALSVVACELGPDEDQLAVRLESIRTRLFERRTGRIRPLLDDKILTDWNGLMIAALAKAGHAFGEPAYLEAARAAADFLWSTMWRDGTLLHRFREGEASITGNVDDYAFLAWGEIELHQATQDAEHLGRAVAVTDAMLEKFRDAESGGMFFSPADRNDLIVRQKVLYDGAVPSGNSVTFLNLLRLARLIGDPEYERMASNISQAISSAVAAHPSGFTMFLSALAMALGDSQELVIVGTPGATDTAALLAVANEAYHPHRVTILRPVGEDAGRVGELASFLADFPAIDGAATAYLCRGLLCERPVTDPADLRVLIEA